MYWNNVYIVYSEFCGINSAVKNKTTKNLDDQEEVGNNNKTRLIHGNYKTEIYDVK